MSNSSEVTVQEIDQDLACPACQYNLRGLRGDFVTCPECGKNCEILRLLAQIAPEEDDPRLATPGLWKIELPGWWFAVGTHAMPLLGLAAVDELLITPLHFGIIVLAWSIVWLGLLAIAWGSIRGKSGLCLVLMINPVLAGRVFAYIGTFVGVMLLLLSDSERIVAVVGALIVTLALAMIPITRWGHRAIARRFTQLQSE